jgi:hypothetical protein
VVHHMGRDGASSRCCFTARHFNHKILPAVQPNLGTWSGPNDQRANTSLTAAQAQATADVLT